MGGGGGDDVKRNAARPKIIYDSYMAVVAHDERDTTRPYQLLVHPQGVIIPAVAGGLTLGLRPGPISVRPAGGPNPAAFRGR